MSQGRPNVSDLGVFAGNQLDRPFESLKQTLVHVPIHILVDAKPKPRVQVADVLAPFLQLLHLLLKSVYLLQIHPLNLQLLFILFLAYVLLKQKLL